MKHFFVIAALALSSFSARAERHFDHVVIFVFENATFTSAMQQPFFQKLAQNGVLLKNMSAETHPSQPNYVAMVAGDPYGIKDDEKIDLDVKHLGDLLEAKKMNWKVYAEGYPGNCFTDEFHEAYARKHNPFILFKNVQKNKARCARIVNAKEFEQDVKSNRLPEFSLYVPDQNNDGHDTGVAFADKFFEKKLTASMQERSFIGRTLFVITFDEDDGTGSNNIYTVLVGDTVFHGLKVFDKLNHYSILRLVEDNFALGTLGKGDATAAQIKGIWKVPKR